MRRLDSNEGDLDSPRAASALLGTAVVEQVLLMRGTAVRST